MAQGQQRACWKTHDASVNSIAVEPHSGAFLTMAGSGVTVWASARGLEDAATRPLVHLHQSERVYAAFLLSTQHAVRAGCAAGSLLLVCVHRTSGAGPVTARLFEVPTSVCVDTEAVVKTVKGGRRALCPWASDEQRGLYQPRLLRVHTDIFFGPPDTKLSVGCAAPAKKDWCTRLP